jgi:hypothetical protein
MNLWYERMRHLAGIYSSRHGTLGARCFPENQERVCNESIEEVTEWLIDVALKPNKDEPSQQIAISSIDGLRE